MQLTAERAKVGRLEAAVLELEGQCVAHSEKMKTAAVDTMRCVICSCCCIANGSYVFKVRCVSVLPLLISHPLPPYLLQNGKPK